MSLVADLIPPDYIWTDLKLAFGGASAALIDTTGIVTIGFMLIYLGKKAVDYRYLKYEATAKAPLTLLEKTEEDLLDCQLTNKTILRDMETVKQERLVERNQDEERLDAQEATIHQLRKEVYDLQAIVLKLTRELDEAMNTIRGLQSLGNQILVGNNIARMRNKT